MQNETITAFFSAKSRVAITCHIWRYDRGKQLQISGVELPTSFQVQFANSPTEGTKPTTAYNTDTVEIPEEYTQSGQPVYAYVYFVGDNYGVTKCLAKIPVWDRGKDRDIEPDPQEQSEIDALVAALNSGVTEANAARDQAVAAADGIEETVQTALTEAKESGEFDGPPGKPGQDGISPKITVDDIPGGHRITITDASGTKSVDVMNGESGGKVQDVQVAGVSVLDAQGVANIPLASATVPGVVISGTVNVSGSTPVINAVDGVRYVCGEVATIDVVPPASGICDVVFTSGSTATVLTAAGVTWPEWFDPAALEANRTYEINIADGLGAVMSWAV